MGSGGSCGVRGIDSINDPVIRSLQVKENGIILERLIIHCLGVGESWSSEEEEGKEKLTRRCCKQR